jgi:hypothetical protein
MVLMWPFSVLCFLMELMMITEDYQPVQPAPTVRRQILNSVAFTLIELLVVIAIIKERRHLIAQNARGSWC